MGEGPSLAESLSGEEALDLFRCVCTMGGTAMVGLAGESWSCGREEEARGDRQHRHNASQAPWCEPDMVDPRVVTYLLSVLIHLGSVCSGKLIGCLQRSGQSLISSSPLLARDWRKALRTQSAFWLSERCVYVVLHRVLKSPS